MPDLQTEWLSAMRRGDYACAWGINDLVLAARDPATRDDPHMPYHLRWVWDGGPFRDRHVLIRCYHGLGDTLQFARYLPILRPLVASLTIEVQPELLPLLATVPGADRLVPFILDAPLPPAECDIEIMELPYALRLAPDAVLPPHLHVRPVSIPPETIGLCWQAGGWDADRSVPASLVTRLAAGPRVTLQDRPCAFGVLNPGGCPSDIAGTAALIAGLALVITVDTMVAHLAGTLNRPTWLLLKHDADWRWMIGRADSPWYPSMRLYRQPSPGDWGSVIERIAADVTSAGSFR